MMVRRLGFYAVVERVAKFPFWLRFEAFSVAV